MNWRRDRTTVITPASAAGGHASRRGRGCVCDLPWGGVRIMRPGAIANLLGDLWMKGEPRFERALAVPEVSLHLYEKHTARAGRKRGHLLATAGTAGEE